MRNQTCIPVCNYNQSLHRMFRVVQYHVPLGNGEIDMKQVQ